MCLCLSISGTEVQQRAAATMLKRVFYVPAASWKTDIVNRGVRVFAQALDHLTQSPA